jgi:hypothetical protein
LLTYGVIGKESSQGNYKQHGGDCSRSAHE